MSATFKTPIVNSSGKQWLASCWTTRSESKMLSLQIFLGKGVLLGSVELNQNLNDLKDNSGPVSGT